MLEIVEITFICTLFAEARNSKIISQKFTVHRKKY
jgi:hypothetical protein